MNHEQIHITEHAKKKWKLLATLHRMDPSEHALLNTLKKASPEEPASKTARFQLLKRSILHGEALTYIKDGLRFVIASNRCVTIEMVRSHHNFFPAGRNR